MSSAAPTAAAERIETLDVVRGFALLGILPMNILAFALPFRAYFDPTADGATAGLDLGVYIGTELFIEGAMRALFSMLFGAGIALLATGARAKSAGVYYRRQLLLLAFGLFDALVLLWMGDILVPYALAGLVLYFCRNWHAATLFVAAGVVFAYLAVFYMVMFASLTFLPEAAAAAEVRLAAGTSDASDQASAEAWRQMRGSFSQSPEEAAREALKYEGTYAQAFAQNAQDLATQYFFVLPLYVVWDVVACMLLGLGLYKTGVLQGTRSTRFYRRLAVVGLACGLLVNAFEVAMKVGSDFELRWVSGVSMITNDLGRVSLALGFVGLIALVCLGSGLPGIRRGLAQTGRMALSNYILHSLIAFFLFHSWGLGLWNDLARHQLYLLVLVIWASQVLLSVWWLGRFRFGPLEWLWRALTYGRLP